MPSVSKIYPIANCRLGSQKSWNDPTSNEYFELLIGLLILLRVEIEYYGLVPTNVLKRLILYVLSGHTVHGIQGDRGTRQLLFSS